MPFHMGQVGAMLLRDLDLWQPPLCKGSLSWESRQAARQRLVVLSQPFRDLRGRSI